MNIKYWTDFSKRKNSTKQPTGGTDAAVTLKNPCSVSNPSIETIGIPDNANYFYIADFGRYYFRSDAIKISKDITQFNLEVDTMASFKSNVGNTTAFILRSSTGYDANVKDAMVIPKSNIVQNVITAGDVLTNLNVLGTDLVVYAVGGGGLKKYLVSPGTVQNIFNTYFDVTHNFSTPAAAIKELFLATADPSKYVKAVKWFPFDVNSGSSEVPWFGFTKGSASVPIARDTLTSLTNITVPGRYYNDWRDFDDRFTKCSVRLPGIGNIQIGAEYLQTALSVNYEIDVNTGDARVQIVAGQKIIANMSTNVGIDIPLGGLGGTGSATALASLVGGIGSIDFLKNTARNTINAIASELSPDQNVVSASGNARDWESYPFVQCSVIRLDSTALAPSGNGRAAYKNALISAQSGYIQCQNASIDLPGTAAEKDTVNGYVNGGFYYE